jgi:thiomorpholine-carboxylate dehydrogenase
VILAGAPIYAELGEIFAGLKAAPTGATTIFKSVGIAIEDIAAAKLVYDLATRDAAR